jgi:hypothetical protein
MTPRALPFRPSWVAAVSRLKHGFESRTVGSANKFNDFDGNPCLAQKTGKHWGSKRCNVARRTLRERWPPKAEVVSSNLAGSASASRFVLFLFDLFGRPSVRPQYGPQYVHRLGEAAYLCRIRDRSTLHYATVDEPRWPRVNAPLLPALQLYRSLHVARDRLQQLLILRCWPIFKMPCRHAPPSARARAARSRNDAKLSLAPK